MKNIGCACVAISALLYAEYGYGAWERALQRFKDYEDCEWLNTVKSEENIADTTDRYAKETKNFAGTKVELSEDGQTLTVFGKDGQKTYNSSDEWISISLGKDKKNKLMWYKNSLVLFDINGQENYSFLADKVYVLGNTNFNNLIVGAKRGFVNFGSIFGKNIKICTHAGTNCGNITASATPNSSRDINIKDADDFFEHYCTNELTLDNAFSGGWKSWGNVSATSVVFDKIDAKIYGSMFVNSAIVKESSFSIQNSLVYDGFSNTWLDYLYKDTEHVKTEVNIRKLMWEGYSTLSISRTSVRDKYAYYVNDPSRMVKIKETNYSKNFASNEMAKFIKFLRKSDNSSNLFFKKAYCEEQGGEKIPVEYGKTKEHLKSINLCYMYKNGSKKIEDVIFSDENFIRFNREEDQKLKNFLEAQIKKGDNPFDGESGEKEQLQQVVQDSEVELINKVSDNNVIPPHNEIEIEEEEEVESLPSNDLDIKIETITNPDLMNDDDNIDTPKADAKDDDNSESDPAKKPTQTQPKPKPTQHKGTEELTPLEEYCKKAKTVNNVSFKNGSGSFPALLKFMGNEKDGGPYIGTFVFWSKGDEELSEQIVDIYKGDDKGKTIMVFHDHISKRKLNENTQQKLNRYCSTVIGNRNHQFMKENRDEFGNRLNIIGQMAKKFDNGTVNNNKE